ncbi:putative phosphomannomutase/phosphoglucomutase [Luminiphilus syltensis NOR5-1B]|uniref:phosphomannomutase n=1 Tax=Luminiphilus syltensis NOR5-1B TaxID=565045 RepID=B8KU97_9GAMM|nr:phosphomannomutase/phosphoglucomutase [Luminiphilus syltensis]EED36176.1 putative phosphomannomutase/phosphoglucomutase [Luminiphilus syltensis NOR5-1B]
MIQTEQRASDKAITVERDALRRLCVKALLLGLLPALIVLLWILLIREPGLQSGAAEQLGSTLAGQRAGSIHGVLESFQARLQALSHRVNGAAADTDLNPSDLGFPEASVLNIIPLDDRGTVGLDPEFWGIESHVAIDLIRQAQSGNIKQIEAIKRDGRWHVLMAQGFDFRGRSAATVALLWIPSDRFGAILNQGESLGTWALVQQHGGGPEQLLAGTAITGSGTYSADVKNTPWQVLFRPADALLDQTRPGSLLLMIAIAAVLVSGAAGAYLLLIGLPKEIAREAKRILDLSGNNHNIALRVPQLQPLATLLYQLNHLNRRKVRSPMRVRSDHEDAASSPRAETTPMSAFSTPPVASVEEVDEATDQPDTEATAATPVPEEATPESFASIIRAHGIRGEVDAIMNDATMKQLGFGLADLAKSHNISTLLLAMDARPSGKQLHTTLAQALLAGNCDIVDLGTVPLPLLHYATATGDVDSGIAITGAGAPRSVNGLDVIIAGNVIGKVDLDALQAFASDEHSGGGKGHFTGRDIRHDYLDKIAVDIGLGLPLKLVVDHHFSATSLVASDVFTAIGCEVISIDDANTDTAPGTELTLQERIAALAPQVTSHGADLGIVFDAEGEQIHTITNRGKPVHAEHVLALLAQDVLERHPGIDILHDLRASRTTTQLLAKAGGRVLPTASSNAVMAASMRDTGALMGGSADGAIYFNDRWYGTADGIYAASRLLELLGSSPSSYDDLINDLPRISPQLSANLACSDEDNRKLFAALSRHTGLAESRLTMKDGLRADFHDGWIAVTQKRAETGLIVTVEANDEAGLERLAGKITAILSDIEPRFALNF